MTTIAADPTAPVHGNPCNITVTSQAANTATGYNTSNYPASPAIVARFRARLAGQTDLFSEYFSTNADQTHVWESVIFPAAGTWTVTLRDSSDTQLGTASVTVS